MWRVHVDTSTSASSLRLKLARVVSLLRSTSRLPRSTTLTLSGSLRTTYASLILTCSSCYSALMDSQGAGIGWAKCAVSLRQLRNLRSHGADGRHVTGLPVLPGPN